VLVIVSVSVRVSGSVLVTASVLVQRLAISGIVSDQRSAPGIRSPGSL